MRRGPDRSFFCISSILILSVIISSLAVVRDGIFLLVKFLFSKLRKNFEGFSQLSIIFARDLTIEPLVCFSRRFSSLRDCSLRESFFVGFHYQSQPLLVIF